MIDASLHSVGKRLLTFALCFMLVLIGSYVQPTYAAGTVTDCSAYDTGAGSLADALAGGGTVTFSCSGTITVPKITITNTVTINATGQAVVLDGDGANGIFYVDTTGNLTLNNLTLQNGNADYGGAIENYGSVTVSNVTMASNHAQWGGGAIFHQNGTLTISDSLFRNNSANGGGAVVVSTGSATINSSTFDGNSASLSGGGAIRITSAVATTITNSTFTNNIGGGGAAAVYSFGNVTITNSTIVNNISGVGTALSGEITVRNSIITGNAGYDCFGDVDTSTFPNFGCIGSVMGNAQLGTFTGRYFPLLPGSVAVDAGDNSICPATDQAGAGRPVNGGKSLTCDLGAIEAQFVTPTLSINDVTLNEGNAGTTMFTFTVSLTAPAPSGGVTFDIATANGTATTADNDYVATSLTGQTIPAGSATYTFSVPVNGDNLYESNETFFVNVTNITGAFVGDTQGQGTITNDDPQPTISINDVTLNEGNAGTTTFSFTVSLTAPAGPDGITFDIATADNTATAADNDYVATSLTAQTIPAGGTTYTFNVLVNGDSVAEANETFFVNVTNITGAITGDTQGTGTILNDDVAGITVTPATGLLTTEAGGTATFSVRLNTQPTADVTIDLVSSNTNEGTVPAQVTILAANWQTGVDVIVTGVDDDVADGDVSYSITLSTASTDPNYAALSADVTVTNQDDDSAGVTITPVTLTTSEAGGTAQFTVLLRSEPTGDVTLTFSGMDATEGTLDTLSLTFTAADWNVPQMVSVTGVDDAVVDGDILYTITTSITSTDLLYAAIDPDDVSVTNMDNDAAGVTITPTALAMTEGALLSYQIALSSMPSSAVTMTLTFDPAQVAVNGSSTSPMTLTFSDSAPQTASVLVVQSAHDSNRSTAIHHAITASVAPEYPVGLSLPSVTISIEDVPPPPPTPLCEDHNFAEGGVVRASTVDGIDFAVNCRVLYQNGTPTRWLGGDLYNAGSIGIQAVLDLGVQQAVDIFSPVGMSYFNGGAVFCLRGQGTLIWLAASGIPRHAEIIGSYTVPEFSGFTCATLFEPGTLVLVRDNPIE